MRVVSTNISTPREVVWKGKNITTGIFKQPVAEITLGYTDVEGDAVIERKYHGGINKACYLYSADHYSYWKNVYPNLEWNFGMFGENMTIKGLDEKLIKIGSQYKVGEAIIEITVPREPCYKLGIRFNDQEIIKKFITIPFCGTYVKVLQEGIVKNGDKLQLIKQGKGTTIAQKYLGLYNSKSS